MPKKIIVLVMLILFLGIIISGTVQSEERTELQFKVKDYAQPYLVIVRIIQEIFEGGNNGNSR